MLLTTFDPFTRDFDRMVDRAFGPAWRNGSAMPMDAVRTEDGLVLRFDLPGIDPASIDVTVDRGVLTVGAKRTEEHAEGEKPFIRERITGTFSRRVRLGDAADAAKVEAGYQDGVLTVRVPLAETAKPRKVEIQAGAPKGLAA
ncbi:MAG TPA: Hsp20/alpha crystallin family protein [Streptosporangiaceae bacterium]|nr:Hsp20/alpha crystallin family protein [Streptosporangiaceae bacterium]